MKPDFVELTGDNLGRLVNRIRNPLKLPPLSMFTPECKFCKEEIYCCVKCEDSAWYRYHQTMCTSSLNRYSQFVSHFQKLCGHVEGGHLIGKILVTIYRQSLKTNQEDLSILKYLKRMCHSQKRAPLEPVEYELIQSMQRLFPRKFANQCILCVCVYCPYV